MEFCECVIDTNMNEKKNTHQISINFIIILWLITFVNHYKENTEETILTTNLAIQN